MKRNHIGTVIASIAALVALVGCHSEPVKVTTGGDTELHPATVRENDDMFLRKVDGRPVPSPSWLGGYRTYIVANGTHTLCIEYYAGNGFGGTWESGPINCPVVLEPDHAYVLKSGRSAFFGSVAGVTTGNVSPHLIDEATKQPAQAGK